MFIDGAGAVVTQGIRIKGWTTIGIGIMFVVYIPSDVISFGNKCKIIKVKDMRKKIITSQAKFHREEVSCYTLTIYNTQHHTCA